MHDTLQPIVIGYILSDNERDVIYPLKATSFRGITTVKSQLYILLASLANGNCQR